MTTAQVVLADAIPPFPFFIENSVDLHRDDFPTNKANNNQFANDDPVVERQKGVPITPLLAHEEVLPDRCQFDHPTRMVVPSDEPERGISPQPLPERCQFFFSDGRQCTMARSEIHPSLCRFHAEREDQLFGDPAPGGNVVGAALDLPELYSACRDLTTASGVNRALGQVFRLLAQRRISRQEAATFGHLAQLLLRSISAARAESAADSSHESPAANVYQSRRNVYQQDELSPQHKVELRGVNKVELSPANETAHPISTKVASPPSAGEPVAVPEVSHNRHVQTTEPNSRKMSTCAKLVRNSREINTSEITGSQVAQNEHLQKRRMEEKVFEVPHP
jgi:hypothetical protein